MTDSQMIEFQVSAVASKCPGSQPVAPAVRWSTPGTGSHTDTEGEAETGRDRPVYGATPVPVLDSRLWAGFRSQAASTGLPSLPPQTPNTWGGGTNILIV
ncbi:hypothetical protein RRG08_037809 [Elysia crispata]|uniref:Uncharacterized protein n=1 Tax=Elysia crispata TaxID=231223 RepID=A0AAE1BDU0_9GAST|nr:hypothetical protein RRG08_037809 [Elysia crispata]